MSLITPIRYPVKYYSWQDDNAPQLTDADGVIKTILKACLITGYGSKEGAGWTLLEEDGDMMVIRRPLRIGNPPDIRIENGQVNGKTSHQMVFLQNNTPTYIGLNARDNRCGKEWHLVVSDFAFIFCYQLLHSSQYKNYAIYVGSMMGIDPTASSGFLVYRDEQFNISGTPQNYTSCRPMAINYSTFLDVADNQSFNQKFCINNFPSAETVSGHYFAQNVIIGHQYVAPYLYSMCTYHDSYGMNTSQVIIQRRPMLRYVNRLWALPSNIMYIPLDYWEL